MSLQVKAGDKIEFISISWDEHHWEFDHPTVLMYPVVQYSPNGIGNWGLIEDAAIEVCCYGQITDEDVSEEFEWRGWKLDRLKRVIRERMQGKDTWKTKIREVMKQTIEFYEGNNGLDYKILKTETY